MSDSAPPPPLPLCKAFLGLARGPDAAPSLELEAALAAAVHASILDRPDIDVDATSFVRYLGRVAGAAAPMRALSSLRLGDLRLVVAYGQQSGEAQRVLEHDYLPRARSVLARLGAPHALAKDIEQTLLKQLWEDVTAPSDRIPYTGRGDLAGWLCVAAARAARRALFRAAREAPLESTDLLDACADTELDYARKLYGAEIRRAFERAFAGLTPRERTVLRYSVLEGLSIDAIGSIYGVHRGTAARWLSGARDRLSTLTREIAKEQIGVGTAEYQSILRWVDADFEISVRRILGQAETS